MKKIEHLITDNIRRFLEMREFVYIGTSDASGQPAVAPKFLIKTECDYIYLADFVLGKTYRNLKVNARASISTIDMDSLTGYQINGLVEIVEQGPQHRAILKDLSEREVKFATERVIATVVKGRRYKNFEVAFPEVFVILKMNVDEVTTIAPTGKLHKKRKSP